MVFMSPPPHAVVSHRPVSEPREHADGHHQRHQLHLLHHGAAQRVRRRAGPG